MAVGSEDRVSPPWAGCAVCLPENGNGILLCRRSLTCALKIYQVQYQYVCSDYR